MRSPSTMSALLLLSLPLAACDVALERGERGRETGVQVSDLVLETWRNDGAHLVVRAESARFDGLPGRGRGELEEVEISHTSSRDAVTVAVGDAASMADDGSLTLRGASLHDQAGNLRITADEVVLGPTGGVEAHRVRARLRVQAQ